MTQYMDDWDYEDDGWKPEDDTEDVLGRPVMLLGERYVVVPVPGLTNLVVDEVNQTVVNFYDDPEAAQEAADQMNS